MKRLLTLLIAVTCWQATQAQISFNTGSTDFDADLNVINTNAKTDLTAFKTDLSVSFNVPLPDINNLFNLGMAPGEVYLGLEIINTANRTVTDLTNSYKKNKGKGWGVIAQDLGIKPGSDQFHALKGKCKNKKDKGNGNGNGNGKSNGNGKK